MGAEVMAHLDLDVTEFETIPAHMILPCGTPAIAHPMWEEQVRLEVAMQREGMDTVEERVVEATSRRQMSHLGPVRAMMAKALPGVAQSLAAWLTSCERSKGPKPVAVLHLCGAAEETKPGAGRDYVRVDAYSASMLGLKCILDHLTGERLTLASMAIALGRTIEHESRVRTWQGADRKDFQSLQRYLDRTDATSGHRSRVNINQFNRRLQDGSLSFRWQEWSVEVHLRLGVAIIDNILRVTSWFEYGDDPGHVHKHGKARHPAKAVIPTAETMGWLQAALKQEGEMRPAFAPTVIPPKRWDRGTKGGYWTPNVNTPRLVRFRASQVHQRTAAADEYEAVDMPRVYEALHAMQETPWRVNRRVLEVAKVAVHENTGLGKLPTYSPVEQAARAPDDIAANPEKLRAWKRDRSNEVRKSLKSFAKAFAAGRTLRLAMQYSDYSRFYFPHMLDFRGRMYPIPVYLQPQGDQFARGLLEFAEGHPITAENEGADWLAVHLASSWGHDKWDFTKRIDWVLDNEEMFRRISAAPLENREWAKSDKPWLALAAVFEWVSFLDEGYGFMSHLPVVVDGTCNGIQHLAAMTRDRITGELVNLTESPTPRDIYAEVAKELQEDLERIATAGGERGDDAEFWLTLTSRNIPRSLPKRQVMVLPYGGTRDSFFTYTAEWLNEHSPFSSEGLTPDQTKAAWMRRSSRLSLVSGLLWDIVHRKVRGGMEVMEWLRGCSKIAAEANQPVFWVTASGFVVRHFYGKVNMKRVLSRLSGEEIYLYLSETTAKMDIQSQLKGVPPNFVHSQDAAALVITTCKCRGRGMVSFTSIHDAYGTHAGQMWGMFRAIREAFIEVHLHDNLGDFRHRCQSVVAGKMVADTLGEVDYQEAMERVEDRMPRPIELGDLDIEEVLKSDYFFS